MLNSWRIWWKCLWFWIWLSITFKGFWGYWLISVFIFKVTEVMHAYHESWNREKNEVLSSSREVIVNSCVDYSITFFYVFTNIYLFTYSMLFFFSSVLKNFIEVWLMHSKLYILRYTVWWIWYMYIVMRPMKIMNILSTPKSFLVHFVIHSSLFTGNHYLLSVTINLFFFRILYK